MMRRRNLFGSAASLLLAWSLLPCDVYVSPAQAQDKAQSEKPAETTRPSSVLPDIEIKASVKARELKFEQVGNASVEFTGKPKRTTASDFDRGNLPDPVQPGIIYRDISVRLVITSAFAEIEKILSEILGEPVRQDQLQREEDQTQQQQASSPARQPSASPQKAKKPSGRKRR